MERTIKEVLAQQWNNKTDMVNHCLKSYSYLETKEHFIEVGEKKPSIQKQFWFDDEQPIPKRNKAYFIEYNLKYNAPRPITAVNNRGDKLILIAQYYNDRTGFQLLAPTYNDGRFNDNDFIEVTPELLTRINEEIEKITIDFKKRLENYWKRYEDKIYFSGYWVNR